MISPRVAGGLHPRARSMTVAAPSLMAQPALEEFAVAMLVVATNEAPAHE